MWLLQAPHSKPYGHIYLGKLFANFYSLSFNKIDASNMGINLKVFFFDKNKFEIFKASCSSLQII
jgi:hypothetical protein